MGIHIQGKENRFGKSTFETINPQSKLWTASVQSPHLSHIIHIKKKIWSHFNMSNIQRATKRDLRTIF